MPLAATGAVALLAACGNTPAPGGQAAGSSDANAGTVTNALSQADLGTKVQQALAKQGSFHVESTTTGEDAGTLTADVRLSGSTAEFVASADKSTVMSVGGQLYGQGANISDRWVKYDPNKKGVEALNNVLIKLLAAQAQPQQYLAGTPYATKFTSTAGPSVDGKPTTLYDVTVDLQKAVAAKAYGDFVTADTLAEQKAGTLTLKVLLDGDSLPRKIDYAVGADGGSATFTKFGDPVVLAAPKIDEVAK
jgi:hypothetical protein